MPRIEVDSNLFVEDKEFKGKKYVDIRKYFQDDDTGKMVPKKGIFLYTNQVPDVISALAKFCSPSDLTPIINEMEALEQGEVA